MSNNIIIYPENNADTQLQKYGNPFGSRKNGIDYTSTFTLDVPLPKNFSWHIVDKSDSKQRQKVKELILGSTSQGKCGNCYAHALSAVLSDLFLIKYGLAHNPDLSSTYMNIHYAKKLQGCAGGNPVEALQIVKDEGLVSNKCVDNSVCMKNNICNGVSHDNASTGELNKLYQSVGDGCYVNRSDFRDEHDLYFPKIDSKNEPYFKVYPNYDDAFSKEILDDSKTAEEFVKMTGSRIQEYPKTWNLLRNDQEEVMKQIYRNGPAVGMILVLNSLMQPFFKLDAFEDVFDGLFFDSVVWRPDGKYEFQNPQLVNANLPQPEGYKLDFDGGHAISIVGYGVCEKEIPVMDFNTNKVMKIKNIPFWWVRNSWGSSWNPKYKGFFKLPMYPFNKVIQVDVPIGQVQIGGKPATIPSPFNKEQGMGGILFLEAGDIKEYKNHVSNDYYKQNPEFTSDKYIVDNKNYYEISNLDFVVEGGVLMNAQGKAIRNPIPSGLSSGKVIHKSYMRHLENVFLVTLMLAIISFSVYFFIKHIRIKMI